MSLDDEIRTQPHVVPAMNFGDQSFFVKEFVNDPQFHNPMSDSSFSFSPSEYKINLPPSMETQIRKLKLSLEPWRELVLITNKVLLWEKSWYSTALWTAVTGIFITIWCYQPPVISLFGLMGLIGSLAQWILPVALAAIFKPENWTSEQQKDYEEVCTNIIFYKTKSELLWSSYNRLKVTNPKMFHSLTVIILACLTLIGNLIDNLFIMYVLVTVALLLPGAQHHGMINNIIDKLSTVFNDLVERAKSKVIPVKEE